jgi:hypothetical protein
MADSEIDRWREMQHEAEARAKDGEYTTPADRDETRQMLTRALTRMTDGYNGADAVLAAELIQKLIAQTVELVVDEMITAHLDNSPHVRGFDS